jgi:hypothetical protein
MNPATSVLTVSAILFGFLFAGFWWSLNRELSFRPEERHFKLGNVLLFAAMAVLGYFGIIVPLRSLARADATLLLSSRGVVLAMACIYGYMLTEFGHYYVFQRQRYTTPLEWVFFASTLLTILALVLSWWII